MSFKKPYVEGDVRYGHTLPKKERLEKEKLEAARRESKVEGLKKRFSVARSAAGGTAGGTTVAGSERNGDGGMEMKELPGSSSADTTTSKKATKSRPGGNDATPR